MALTTVRRNATRKLATIRQTYTRVRTLDASSEWTNSTPDTAWTYYDSRPGSALLQYNDTHDRYELIVNTSLAFHLERPEGEKPEQTAAAPAQEPASDTPRTGIRAALTGEGRPQPPSKHTTVDPDSGSPYFPGAPAWYLRAARKAIDGRAFPDVTPETDLAPGKTGVWITSGRQEQGMGRIMVVPVIVTKKTTYSERPRRGTDAEAQWLAARDDLRAQLSDAGFSALQDMKMGLEATPPAPAGRTVIELVHGNVFEEGVDALGRYQITVPDHPHLHGLLITYHGHQSAPAVYAYAHADHKDPLFRSHGFRTNEAATKAWAAHCGFPEDMVKIIEK